MSYQGSSYVAVSGSTGEAPGSGSSWKLLASQGEQGLEGPQGPKGEPGEDATPSIAGVVNADGTPREGSGYDSEWNPDTNNYTVTFPSGTWNDIMTVVVTPAINANTVQLETVLTHQDGSGEFTVSFDGQQSIFTFIATEVES